MKHLLLPILLALSFGAAAQKIHFTDTSNRWTVKYGSYNEITGKMSHYYRVWALKDTSVLGESVKCFVDGDGNAHDWRLFIQEDTANNIIIAKYFDWDADTLHTGVLYDFSMNVDDTVRSLMYDDMNLTCHEVHTPVLIESLGYNAFSWFGYFGNSLVIESVGSLDGPTAPWDGGYEWGTTLTCFEHKGVQVTFSDYFANDCEILSVNEKTKQSINLSLFPNPAAGYINIEAANTINRMSLSVFDVLGREMHRGNLQNATKIDISTWADGIYMVHVKDEQGNISISRFMKR